MTRLSFPAVMLFSWLLVAANAGAQGVSAQSAAVDRPSATAQHAPGANQAGISHGAIVRHTRQADVVPAHSAAALQQSRSGRGRTLMIVGGAAFLAGLIIGDDAGTAIAIGGAAVGIYGLYLWAQTQP